MEICNDGLISVDMMETNEILVQIQDMWYLYHKVKFLASFYVCAPKEFEDILIYFVHISWKDVTKFCCFSFLDGITGLILFYAIF